MIIHILLGINSIWGFFIGMDLVCEDLGVYGNKLNFRHIFAIACWVFFGVWGMFAISWFYMLVFATIDETIRVFKKLVGKK